MTRDRSLDPYQAIGGIEGCRQLSTAFYARVERDPVLRPLFPSLHCAIESFTLFLAQFLGGPCDYSDTHWTPSLRESHERFKIGARERTAWLKNMRKALAGFPVEDALRTSLNWFFEQSSAYIIKEGAASKRPPQDTLAAIVERWNTQRELEEAFAAVRAGDAPQAIQAAESLEASLFPHDPAARLNLLARMSGAADPELNAYVRRSVKNDPALVHQTYAGGRTLLHGAAGAGGAETVELLLTLGADPKAVTKFGHTPLYALANECSSPEAGRIVHLLVNAGADVNACDGVMRCTPLHMAARRGNAEVAGALLDHGAAIEARDNRGDTPLRRAVNCGKPAAVACLLIRGADPHAPGSKGLTPAAAARTSAIRALFDHASGARAGAS